MAKRAETRSKPTLAIPRVPKFTHGRCNKALCALFYRIPCPGFRISSDATGRLRRFEPMPATFLRFFERTKVRPRRGGTFLGFLRPATSFLSSRNSCLPAIKFFAFLLFFFFSFFFYRVSTDRVQGARICDHSEVSMVKNSTL